MAKRVLRAACTICKFCFGRDATEFTRLLATCFKVSSSLFLTALHYSSHVMWYMAHPVQAALQTACGADYAATLASCRAVQAPCSTMQYHAAQALVQMVCATLGAPALASGSLLLFSLCSDISRSPLSCSTAGDVPQTNSILPWQHALQQLSSAALQLLFYRACSRISTLLAWLMSSTPVSSSLAVVQVLFRCYCPDSSRPQLCHIHWHTAHLKSLAVPLQVLSHWACSKISAAADMADQQLHDVITARLKGYSGVRYSLVAAHAEGVGRRSLAAMLLENESCAADQVRMSS